VVASSSVQIWAGGMGTVIPPYDFAAFRANPTETNQKVRGLHTSYCHLLPPGDRWRNMCHAASPMQLFMILQSDDATYNLGKPHEVESAYNGLAMYPMSLIRSRGKAAQYDSGDDNQRCEHVGFHLSLRNTMYVNPKWSMNLKPSKPGGPTGKSAITTSLYAIVGRPTVMFAILFALVLSIIVFSILFVCPLWMIGISIKSLWRSGVSHYHLNAQWLMPMQTQLDIGVFNSIKPSFSANCWKFPCAGRSNEQSSSSTQSKKCIAGEAMRETRGQHLNAKKANSSTWWEPFDSLFSCWLMLCTSSHNTEYI